MPQFYSDNYINIDRGVHHIPGVFFVLCNGSEGRTYFKQSLLLNQLTVYYNFLIANILINMPKIKYQIEVFLKFRTIQNALIFSWLHQIFQMKIYCIKFICYKGTHNKVNFKAYLKRKTLICIILYSRLACYYS